MKEEKPKVIKFETKAQKEKREAEERKKLVEQFGATGVYW